MAPQRLGQHFLIKGSVLERIAAAACPDATQLVIEIGPGRGALTERLLKRAARVIAVELDPYLVEHLGHKFPGEPRLTVVHGDALTTDFDQWGPAVVVGNLPYYITSPILEKVLDSGATSRAVFLIQKEVAERLVARPCHRDYGYLTARTALSADAQMLFEVKPSAFHPPPKVDSAVVRLDPRNRAAELGIADRDGFARFLRLSFHQKRKTLRNNLAPVYGKERIEGLPESGLRAEQLSLDQFAGLYRELNRVRP